MNEYRLCNPQPTYKELRPGIHALKIGEEFWPIVADTCDRRYGWLATPFGLSVCTTSSNNIHEWLAAYSVYERIPEEPPSPRHWKATIDVGAPCLATVHLTPNDYQLPPNGNYILISEEDWKERADTWNEGYEAGTGRP